MTQEESTLNCMTNTRGIKDSMSILSGKWKLHILGTLLFCSKMRFNELQRELEGISAKVLSRELKDLELNQLICRMEMNEENRGVTYEISPFGKTLKPVIQTLIGWGNTYRQEIVNQLESRSNKKESKN